MNTFRKHKMIVLAAATSAALFASTSSASTHTWVGPDNGAWNEAGHWSPNQVPQAGDTVYVINSGLNFVTANFGNHLSPMYGWLHVDSSNSASSWMTMKQTGGVLASHGAAIGGSHNGSFTQEGGLHDVAITTATPFYIGQGNGSTGLYNLLGGTLNSGAMYLGYQGNGHFNQDNGRHNVNQLMLGAQLNGVGAYSLNGGTLSAGTVTIGAASGGAGKFYLNGGTLNAQRMIMGSPGAGSFNMNGGTLNVSRDAIIGNSNFNTAAATVTWNITGGRTSVGSMTIGNTSPGWVDQFGASTVSVADGLYVGKGANGFLRLNAPASGGSAPQLTFGGVGIIVGTASGTGEVVLNGGNVWGNGALNVAYERNARGTVTQNGVGAISSFAGIGIAAGTNASGVIDINGGAMTCRSGSYTAIGNGGSLRINGTGNFVAHTGIVNNGQIAVNAGSCYFGELTTTTDTGQLLVGIGTAEGKRLEQNLVVIGSTSANTGHIKLERSPANATDVQRRNVIGSLSMWLNEANAYKGYLDLSNNDLILTQTSYSTATAYLRAGYNDGEWNGNGIRSSAAGATAPARTLGILRGYEYINNTGASTFDGRSVGLEDVLIKYTYFGDVDFNGQVEVSDYNLIDFGFANHLSGWGNGDVDFNGSVDAGDYNLIDFAFVTQNNTLNRAIAYLNGADRDASTMTSDPSLQHVVAHFVQFGEVYATGFLAQVPEPSTAMIAITSIAAAMTTRRRRRRTDDSM